MEKAWPYFENWNFSSIPSFPLSETLYDQSALINRIEPGRLQPLFESTPINI